MPKKSSHTLSTLDLVCRNSVGCIFTAVSQISLSCDPNLGEALFAFFAVQLASSPKLKDFTLEVDSL